MNNLLYALQKEKRIMSDRVHNISLYLHKKSEVISKTPYTDADLKESKDRLSEVEVAIKAILEHRKKTTQHEQHK